jgi:hypothetical protein
MPDSGAQGLPGELAGQNGSPRHGPTTSVARIGGKFFFRTTHRFGTFPMRFGSLNGAVVLSGSHLGYHWGGVD